MKKYVVKSWVDYSDGTILDLHDNPAQAFTVYEEDGQQFTGLLDQDGNPIMRLHDKVKLGYL
jgi:hypothetical protein